MKNKSFQVFVIGKTREIVAVEGWIENQTMRKFL